MHNNSKPIKGGEGRILQIKNISKEFEQRPHSTIRSVNQMMEDEVYYRRNEE